MICVDEFGPMELRPTGGRSWRRQGKPERFRATYTRPHGVRHYLAALDLKTNELWGQVRRRKRRREFLIFLKALRTRWPEGRLWLVLDNFSPHLGVEVRGWCRQNNVRLCFLPTDASWLNRIECQFTPLRKAVLTCCDYGSHTEQTRALHRWVRWRNRKKSIPLSQKGH